ncbi:hypothetical protein BaRGS_00037528 [Batillaria attramentaria]|uniref:TIR domain-containing protein n=2 Tax=Batillaria attramentaria TaxID=370345 RepID=A0ABD0J8L8_9CAEN
MLRTRFCYKYMLDRMFGNLVKKIGLVVILMLTLASGQDAACTRCSCWNADDCQEKPCCQEPDVGELVRINVIVNCSQPDRAYIGGPGLPSGTSGSAQCSGFHLMHTSSCLTSFPENHCSFNRTRAITVSWTFMSEFPALGCLSSLQLLDLRHNKLTSVPRDAFQGMTMVMEIRLDDNLITHIHPGAFDAHLPNLNVFSASHNLMVTHEPWILTMRHPFCKFDFSHNRIRQLTNDHNWKVDLSPDVHYGPGYVDMSHNQFRVPPWAQFGQYGIKPIPFLAKFVMWGFDLRDNPFHCDCEFYDVVVWIRRLASVMRRDYYNITCASPPRFKGMLVRALPAAELSCDVTKHCPESCSCHERPAYDDVLVDCAGRNLSELPDVMPKGRLTLDFARNSLGSVEPRDYFERALSVNLSDNHVQSMDAEVPRLLKATKFLDLRHNVLRYLPYTLQIMSPKDVFLDLDTLHCSCDLSWFPEWTQEASSTRFAGIICTKNSGLAVSLTNATREALGCDGHGDDTSPYHLSLITVGLLVLVVAVLLVAFRHELLVLTHTLTHRFKRRSAGQSSLNANYDVFLSSADTSQADNAWMCSKLLPALEGRRLRCYWPCRDCLPGTVEMEQATKRLHESATALVLLSPDYINNAGCLFQFHQAYNQMVANGQGRLVLVRLEPRVSSCSIHDPKLRAMVRLRLFFTAGRLGCLEQIVNKLSSLRANRDSGADAEATAHARGADLTDVVLQHEL